MPLETERVKMKYVEKEKFRYRFTQAGQPNDVILWPGEEHRCRVQKLEESHYQTVHIRWPSAELRDHECDEPRKLAREIADRLAGYVQNRRTTDEYAAFELALFDWLIDHRAAAAIRDHE